MKTTYCIERALLLDSVLEALKSLRPTVPTSKTTFCFIGTEKRRLRTIFFVSTIGTK